VSSDCELQSAPSRHRSILLLNCIDVLSENTDTFLGREMRGTVRAFLAALARWSPHRR